MIRVPVSHETVTVLGSRVKANSPAWTGLDLANAEPRVQSSLMLTVIGPGEAPLDIHLNVPWCHPDDRTGSPDDFDCRYRVRPRMEAGKRWKGKKVVAVAFERWDGKWWIAVEFAGGCNPDAPHPQAPTSTPEG